MKQVDKTTYNFNSYCGIDRWSSYYYQIREVLLLNPNSILEVGIGDRVFGNYIKNNTKINYVTLDIAEDLDPDILGSIEDIPLDDKTFDVVCAFEVIEHLPFEKFEKILKELNRISKNYVVISLPHFGPQIKFLIKIPFLKEIKFSFKIPYYKKHIFNKQHYWEIGKKTYTEKRIRKILKKYFKIDKEFIPFENQYHHFYVLKV